MDENQQLQPVDVNEEEVEHGQKIDKPYGCLELVSFGNKSKLKGFQFYQRQYKSTQDAVNHVSSFGKNGEEIIVGLINSAISFATRTKASNSAPSGETDTQTKDLIKGALERGETLLITEEEAEKYIPGTRERYALGYFQREYLAARKAFVENKNEDTKAKFITARAALEKAQLEDFESQLEAAGEPVPASNATPQPA